MILWTFKLIKSVRKAIAGRKHPSQLAWGLALGCLLGLIPHGNLLAVALVLVVLTLRVNHAMVGLSAILVTLFAPRLDPLFHGTGEWFFARSGVGEKMALAWQYPLVPWTDLNNTVVMGSFLIGLLTLVPIFLLTYPVFRNWALALDSDSDADLDEDIAEHRDTHPVTQINRTHAAHQEGATPHVAPKPSISKSSVATTDVAQSENAEPIAVANSGRAFDVRRIDAPQPEAVNEPVAAKHESKAQTQVAIVTQEAASVRPPTAASANEVQSRPNSADDQTKIDEALSYLLRQLRDSQDKDAA